MNKAKPRHIAMDQFQSRDNQLCLAGKTIREIQNSIGSTPFYAYDGHVIDRQVASVRQLMPDAIKLHYAIKANPLPALVNYLARQVDGFDVASDGEMYIALNSGMSAHNISIAGPGKKLEELEQAIKAGIVIHLESEAELNRALLAAEKMGRKPKLALRVNPDFALKASGMKMGGGAKPFGVDAEQCPALLRRMNSLDIDFQGFHIFTGSQNLLAEAICEAQQKTLALAIDLARQGQCTPKRINLGGGFGIPYFPGDRRLALQPIGEGMHELQQQAQAEFGECELILELGRYLVGECGVYIAQIIEKKISRGQCFFITDGGLHHHLAASGNFGQVLRKNYPVAIANRLTCENNIQASVVGPLCTPLDILADNIDICDADAGDLVVVYQSGAYGYTASPSAFLSHPPAKELFFPGEH